MPTVVENLNESLAGVSACCNRLVRELDDAVTEASKLSAMPHWEGATLYFRAGKYAYLHEWKPNGCRIRRYVGCSPRRVRNAELLVAGGMLVAHARVRVSRLEAECKQLTDTLRRTVHLVEAAIDLESRLESEVSAAEQITQRWK